MMRSLFSLSRNFAADRSGNAAVELALSLPMVLALIFTTMEGAHFLYTQHKVIKGVRDGARYAARLPFSTYTCPSTPPTDPALTNIRNLTRTGYINGDNPNVDGTDNPVVRGWTNANIAVTLNCSSATNTGVYQYTTGGAPRIKVSAQVSYPSLFSILGFAFAPNAKLNAAAQAAVMGS